MNSPYLTLILFLLTLPAQGAEEQFSCWVDHEAEAPTVRCNDDGYWAYADVNHLEQPGEFQDVYCSQAFRDHKSQESKSELKRRLMEEDLMSLANGKKPRCYTNGKRREKDAEREVVKAIEAIGVGRLRNSMPPYCEIAARPPSVPQETPEPAVIHPKDLPAEKKEELKKKENERLGVKKSATVNPPRTVSEAIADATRPVKPDPNLQLELCLALDTSGSMTDDVEFIRDKFKELEQTWKSQYPGGLKITIVEFGQDGMDRAELRTPLTKKGTPELNRYLGNYKSVGFIEPKFDAISKCAKSITAPQLSDRGKIQREVIVLSDELGDSLPGSPSPETAGAAVKAKSAKLTLIDPAEIFRMKNQLKPPVDLSVKSSPLGAERQGWRYALSLDRKLIIETESREVSAFLRSYSLYLKQQGPDGKWIESKVKNSESRVSPFPLGFRFDGREAIVIQSSDTYIDPNTGIPIDERVWLKVLNTESGDLIEIKELFGRKPLDAIYTSEGNRIFISMADGAVVTADRQKDNSWKTSLHAEFQQVNRVGRSVVLSPDQKTLVVQGYKLESGFTVPTMTFWNRQSDGTWKLDLALEGGGLSRDYVVFAKDSTKVITQSMTDKVHPIVFVEKNKNGNWVKKQKFHELSGVTPLAFSEKRNLLLGKDKSDHLILVKQASSGNSDKKTIYYRRGSYVDKVEFSADDKWIYATLTNGTLLTFDVETLLK